MSTYFKVVPESSVPSPAGSAENFDGQVWQADVLRAEQPGGLRGHRFAYAPGGRSHWHVHTGEQALIVVAGRGLIQWEGLDEPRELQPGDWVHVEPGVPHWHGAADDSIFVHLAVTATGATEWGDRVER
ncbi:cupin [Actinoplanes cyaneus]|uniref:Cupin n=1 Tax=Actinoplanes cyaneus TaxID=52696 RepID=A0A919M5R1_9ACTN|nr:cupin domain-containing protein [Actinoplanes cyaneus]MCW2140168.1 Cupin domain protein [Actinoplanes cyaneus]GID65483.1 cupin [Actinoplanes cyaneus]